MDEQSMQFLAAQLRQPSGEHGVEVALQMNRGNEMMNRETLRHLNISANDNILEIGMGNGYFVKDILTADATVRYTGCDYSALMVNAAIEMNREAVSEGRAVFQKATASNLPYADNSFNKAFAINTLYFWENPAIELAEIKRVVQHGGLVIITIKPKEDMDKMPFTQYGFQKYAADTLSSLLTENGFDVINIMKTQEPPFDLNGRAVQMSHILGIAKNNKQ